MMAKDINKVRGYRVMVGMTQDEMAEKLNISLRTYIQKENNQSFKTDQLREIAMILQGYIGLEEITAADLL